MTMLTINEHSLRYARLKKADAQVRAKHGANHTLGLPSEWSPTPRAGARWSEQECEALVSAIETYYKVRNQPLTCYELAELGWKIGRSANSINEQALKLLPRKSFCKMINTNL